MTARPPDQFDVIYEACRIQITRCVDRLFCLDPQGGQWLDDAVVDLSTSMNDALVTLRNEARPLEGITGTPSELGSIYDLDLGYACANRSPTLVDDSELELYWREPSPDHQRSLLDARLDSPPDTESTSSDMLYSAANECSNEELLQTSAHLTTPILSTTVLEGQGNLNHSTLEPDRSTQSVHARVTKVSPRSRGKSCGSSGVRRSPLFELDGDGIRAVAGTVVFKEFCGAIKFIRHQQTLKLPAKHESVQSFLAFLDTVTDAKFACHLLYRVGSWRFLRQYYRLTGQKKEERDQRSGRRQRLDKGGKATSQARSLLIAQSTLCAATSTNDSPQAVQQRETKLDNRIEASKIWYEFCETAGPALVGMIPPLPRTSLERLPIKERRRMLSTLIKTGGRLDRLTKSISPHLEAILENKACLLGALVENDKIRCFDDILDHSQELSRCDHLDSPSAE